MRLPGLLHTSPVHVTAFDTLLARAGSPRAVHRVDEALLADARRDGPEAVADRVTARIEELAGAGADIVCCTCSTIGGVAERVDAAVPVIRVDRPMASAAVRAGRRIGVVAALGSTLRPTRDLLVEEAARAGRDVDLALVTAEGAWELFEGGDQSRYVERVAAVARDLAGAVDVLVLAQASMAGAEELLADLVVPVLSSPRLAVAHLTNAR